MRIDIITVFPEMFRGFLGESILSRAVRMGKVFIRTVDLRDFARDQRRTVDDKPYSGGPGMLMKPDVWFQAIEACTGGAKARVVMTTPAGRPYTQRIAEDFARSERLVILCGHYEGIDERVKTLVTDEISMGDFVLTGGEIPAAAIVDSVVRLLPGVLGGGDDATAKESFGGDGMLEAPQYTRPPEYRGLKVPETLLGGDHAKTESWRKRQAFDLTSRNRPDLLAVGGTHTVAGDDTI
jgi:tRNA (guanine37-N1)-methyltransferase